MAANSQFAMATHIMAAIASKKGARVSSSYLADSLNTNPVVVRRILTELQEAGLVKNFDGRKGGSVLAIEAQKIGLNDIYSAVDKNSIFAYNPNNPNKSCPMSCTMKSVLGPIFNGASESLILNLKKTKLSDVLNDIQKKITKESS